MMARSDDPGASQHKSLRPRTAAVGRVLELIRRNQGVLGLIILVALSSLPIGFHLGKARISPL